jgi:hypothetical protein
MHDGRNLQTDASGCAAQQRWDLFGERGFAAMTMEHHAR